MKKLQAKSSETEQSLLRQPEVLGFEWDKRISQKCRQAIRNAKAVTFVGTGSSFHCAHWADWLTKISSNGKLPSRAISSWDFLVSNQARVLAKNELVVLISHRGNKSLSRKVLESLKNHRHILIAGEGAETGKSPFIYTCEQEISNAHTKSLIGAMAAASEIIAMLLPAKISQKIKRDRLETSKLLADIGQERTELGDALGGIMTRGAGFHIVGGGPFHSVALELDLKAREVIHLPAHSYNTEEFLHGPMTSFEEQDTLLVLRPIGKNNDLTSLQNQLYQDRLNGCRAAAEAVGALVIEPAWGEPVLSRAATLGLAWQAMLPLYWGQVMCLATAVLWGINPDSNRREDPRYEQARRKSDF